MSKGKEGRLSGVPIVIGDNISTKGIKTTANSKMLENYIPSFNATVVERILEEGGVIQGKGSIKEFGVGSSDKPWGTAKSVAQGQGIIGIASDTEGEVRKSACHYGIYGLKPSYGLVSRYGLIAYASSIDSIGILGGSLDDIALVLDIIAGKDPKDSTSLNIEKVNYSKSLDRNIKEVKIGILDDAFGQKELKFIDRWKEVGVVLESISIPSLEYGPQAYEIISSGEFSSNMARFDGIAYGYRGKNYDNIDELYKNSRSESLGQEVKKKILFGNFVLSSGQYREYYQRAQKIRSMIRAEFDKIFKDYDIILSTVSSTATIGASLAGLPALSLAKSHEDKDMGIQLIGPAFSEEKLLRLGYVYGKYMLEEDRIGGGNNG